MNYNNYFGEEILLRVPSNRSLTNSKRIVVRYASSDSKIKKCICLENYQIYDIILKNQPVMMIYYIGGELHYIPYESGLKKLAVKNMGLALLERQQQKDNQTGRLANNYLYLITNTYFPREETLRIIAGGERFSDLDFTPVLVKNERQNMGILEDYISLKLQGQVFYMNERRELVELLMR